MNNVFDFNALLKKTNERDDFPMPGLERRNLDAAMNQCSRVDSLIGMACDDLDLMSDIIEVAFDSGKEKAREFDAGIAEHIKANPEGRIAQVLKAALQDYV